MKRLMLGLLLLAGCASMAPYKMHISRQMVFPGQTTRVMVKLLPQELEVVAVGVVWGDGSMSARHVFPQPTRTVFEEFIHAYEFPGVYLATVSVATAEKVLWCQDLRIEVL